MGFKIPMMLLYHERRVGFIYSRFIYSRLVSGRYSNNLVSGRYSNKLVSGRYSNNKSGRAIQPRYSWPLPALIHWEVKVGGQKHEGCGGRRLCWKFAVVSWSGAGGRQC